MVGHEQLATDIPFIGWREWVALPDLGIPAIKAKIDTGARTSCLHAFYVEPFDDGARRRVRFGVHPLRRITSIELHCEADVLDERNVSDSGGHVERRIVIATQVVLSGQAWPIEITLTNRENMLFRMLIGRTALRSRFRIDPGRSFINGRKLRHVYATQRKEKS